MPLESTIVGVQSLNPAWPTGTDPKSQGDDHIRTVKSAIQQSFPNMTAAWTTSSKIKSAGLDASNAKVENVAAATVATDAVNKSVTDALNTRLTTLEGQQGRFQSFGCVQSSGASSGGTGDFSVVRNSIGSYTITFTEASTTQYGQSLQVTIMGVSGFAAASSTAVNPTNTTTWTLLTYGANDALADLPWAFIRVAL